MIRVRFRWRARGACRHPEAMTRRGASLCAADFPAMVGVIEHPSRGVLLLDTGYDAAFAAATDPFPERLYRWATPVEIGAELEWAAWLAALGLAPADVQGVVVSHFHGDHVAGLRHAAGLPVFCARADLAALRRGGRLSRVRQGLLPALVPPVIDAGARFFEDCEERPLPSAFAPFERGRDVLGDGSLLAVELPGHCAGHWGLALRTEDDRFVLLAADAAWSGEAIRALQPPPRLTTALLGETRPYRRTLAALHGAQGRNPELAILPSHCAVSAAAFETAS